MFKLRLSLVLLVTAALLPCCRERCADREYIEKGDLEELKERGRLRILVPATRDNEMLPRQGPPLEFKEEMAREFARQAGMAPMLVYVDRYDELLDKLVQGEGDMVAANLTVTEGRKRKAAFTSPLMLVKEQVIARADDHSIQRTKDLANRGLFVRRSSSYWETLTDLKDEVPDMKIVPVEEDLDTEQIIHGVATGKYDLTVADENIIRDVLRFRDDVRPVLAVTGERPVAWAVRPGADELLRELNRFIDREKLEGLAGGAYKEDLPGIKQRKVLRVLTRNNAVCYFLWRGELVGFEYDLVKKFAKELGLRVMMIVPPGHGDLIPWLEQGKGDLIAASYTITEERQKDPDITFSRPYNYVSEVVVARADEEGLEGPEDLAGRTMAARRGSSYWQTLTGLQEEGLEFSLQEVPQDMETEEIIERVANGEYDLTLADSHILEVELSYRDDVKGVFRLSEDRSHGWVVRSEDEELLQAINSFIQREYRGLFYNVTYNKYFKHERRVRTRAQERAENGGLSPYDGAVKRYADRYNLDWRLVIAQMYQESRFNPATVSWAGAVGLMQVLPRTARELGFSNVRAPEANIHAGIRYLWRMRSRFPTDLPMEERMNFALASYNAGYGHVLDARRLAQGQGLDPDRWPGNVEKAMLLLANPRYYKRARYGYCRGSEPVNYVHEINNRYAAYINIAAHQ